MTYKKKCSFVKMSSKGRIKHVKKPSRLKKILVERQQRMKEWREWWS